MREPAPPNSSSGWAAMSATTGASGALSPSGLSARAHAGLSTAFTVSRHVALSRGFPVAGDRNVSSRRSVDGHLDLEHAVLEPGSNQVRIDAPRKGDPPGEAPVVDLALVVA